MLKLRSEKLLLVASAVWLLAGINILRLGLCAIIDTELVTLLLACGIAISFFLFHLMFTKLVGKQSARIRAYNNELTCAFAFFDVKGYVMMVIMMGGGILLRETGIIPEWIVAFLYTGIGAALALAGIGFALHYLKRGGMITCPITKKTRLA
jgi:hypothetical protein